MNQLPDIFESANMSPLMQEEIELLYESQKDIRGSVKYDIKRFRKQPQWNMNDVGILNYHYKKNNTETSFLELKFCITGNVFCREKNAECDFCKFNDSKTCLEKIESTDVLSFSFSPNYLKQFAKSGKKSFSLSEKVFSFTHTESFSSILPLCAKTRTVIEALLNHEYTDSHENIFINAQMQLLLLYSTDCMFGEKDEKLFECKFLTNDADREKIINAREILLQHIGEPITIKALSRKVAINECYLKKGFKEIFGTTIFDFYQGQRMEHAKYLLFDKGLSVTEVSNLLGYSSISHFSTAFKKHTGIKPCELLTR